jgi:hypothetical protein
MAALPKISAASRMSIEGENEFAETAASERDRRDGAARGMVSVGFLELRFAVESRVGGRGDERE